MYTGEWYLVAFTLLTQTAVGALIFAGIAGICLKDKLRKEELYVLLKPTQYIVGILTIVGLITSLLHLGTPINAPKAILNIGSSWLSREILVVSAFLILWSITFYVARSKKEINIVLVAITSIVGLILVFAIGKVYSSTIIPAWQHLNTYIVFYGTTFLLGTIVAFAAIVFAIKNSLRQKEGEVLESILAPLSSLVLIAIMAQVIVTPLYILSLATGDLAAVASAQVLYGQYALALGLSWGLVLFGGVIVIVFIWKHFGINSRQGGYFPSRYVYLALAAVLLGEVIGRYLFYASAVPMMIG